MEIIELPTPFAIVNIVIEDKDKCFLKEIEEWIYWRCGVPTKAQVKKHIEKIEQLINEGKLDRVVDL